MELEEKHIKALHKAEKLLECRDFCRYFELKNLLQLHKKGKLGKSEQDKFCQLFNSYYGLNRGGLSDKWKKHFYEILFEGKNLRFQKILPELKAIPRKKGDCAMPYSFSSKLVAIHNEDSPIVDRHVLAFFGKKLPNSKRPDIERIFWFIKFVRKIKSEYNKWVKNNNVSKIIKKLKNRDSRFAKCSDIRLLDFLVWKVGNKKLLVEASADFRIQTLFS